MQVHFWDVVNYVKSWSASVYLKKKKHLKQTHVLKFCSSWESAIQNSFCLLYLSDNPAWLYITLQTTTYFLSTK